jgi:hypothetical protein
VLCCVVLCCVVLCCVVLCCVVLCCVVCCVVSCQVSWPPLTPPDAPAAAPAVRVCTVRACGKDDHVRVRVCRMRADAPRHNVKAMASPDPKRSPTGVCRDARIMRKLTRAAQEVHDSNAVRFQE